MNDRCHQAGFTLIELLVSLTLLGLMMGLIGTALPLAMTAAAKTRGLSDALSAVQTAQDLLRRQIGEMPIVVSQAGYDRHVLFSGAPGAMRFAAFPLAAQGGGGAGIVALSVEKSGADSRLRYVSGDETRYLIKAANSIRFSYFGALTAGGETAWREVWKDSTQAPQLVRVQVRPVSTALPWPDLVIAVMAQSSPP